MAATEGCEESTGRESHALLLSPSFERREWDCCASFLYPDVEGSVIAVSHTDTPAELVARWRDSGGVAPKHFGAIFANSANLDSRALTAQLREAFDEEDVLVGSAVVAPSDLTQINIEVNEMLGMWDAEGERIALCIASLTTLLQYADVARVFKFLHATVSEFKAAAATTSTHVHLDPDAIPDQDVARIRTLMTEVVDVRETDEG